MLSLTAFSQNATVDSTITLSSRVGKLVVKDLILLDQTKEELKLEKQENFELQNKIDTQIKIISTHEEKEKNFVTIIDSQNQKYKILEDYSESLERNLKKERVKNKFKSILSSGLIMGLGILLIVN